jgi:hypothetical protein
MAMGGRNTRSVVSIIYLSDLATPAVKAVGWWATMVAIATTSLISVDRFVCHYLSDQDITFMFDPEFIEEYVRI